MGDDIFNAEELLTMLETQEVLSSSGSSSCSVCLGRGAASHVLHQASTARCGVEAVIS